MRYIEKGFTPLERKPCLLDRVREYIRKNISNVSSFLTGFTVIELVMIMVIVGILAAVIVVRWDFDYIKLYSATRKVAGDIRYTQKLAITNQTRAGIEFNTNGYSVYNDTTVLPPYPPATSPGDSCSTDPLNNFVVDFTQSRCSNYSGVTLSFTTSVIAFNSLGTPVDAAGTPFGTNQTITLSYSGLTPKTITIETGTGRVSY
jgi:Tfp pilus assembly protein FimT